MVFSMVVLSAFGQEKCDKNSIETMIQERLAISKEKESTSQENYEKAVDKLAQVKKWDTNEKLRYLMDMVSTESFQKSTSQKFSILQEAMNLLKEVNTEKATKENCKLKTQIKEKLDGVIANNQSEWKKVMIQVKKDYKAITNKDLEIDANKKVIKKEETNNPLRPSSLVGVWIDVDKEENYVFNADGTVYDQSYKTKYTYNKRYWYAKDGKICFTFSNKTEGGMCPKYSIKGDILSILVFGEYVKYKKKR